MTISSSTLLWWGQVNFIHQDIWSTHHQVNVWHYLALFSHQNNHIFINSSLIGLFSLDTAIHVIGPPSGKCLTVFGLVYFYIKMTISSSILLWLGQVNFIHQGIWLPHHQVHLWQYLALLCLTSNSLYLTYFLPNGSHSTWATQYKIGPLHQINVWSYLALLFLTSNSLYLPYFLANSIYSTWPTKVWIWPLIK